jgi:hypothetical protein
MILEVHALRASVQEDKRETKETWKTEKGSDRSSMSVAILIDLVNPFRAAEWMSKI